jgi:hypothetical protein
VVRRWIAHGWLPSPPWTVAQLHEVGDLTDPDGRACGPGATHGTETRWTQGCNCDLCGKAHTDAARANDRRRGQRRLPVEVRQRLLDAIYVAAWTAMLARGPSDPQRHNRVDRRLRGFRRRHTTRNCCLCMVPGDCGVPLDNRQMLRYKGSRTVKSRVMDAHHVWCGVLRGK